MELAWRTRLAAALGLTGTAGVGLDWGTVIARKNRIVASWSEGKDTSLERQGIAVLRGDARFTGPHELRLGDRQVSAERVVIATGSAPARPPIAGIERTVTSTELLDRSTLPQRMVVIGGGMIAMELGFVFGRAGAHVTVLQAGSDVLPGVDDEMRATLVRIASGAGLDIRTRAKVTGIAGDRTVEAEVDGARQRFPAEVVLVATGRPPNIAGLQLEAAGVAVEGGRIKVNEFRQSLSTPHIYVAGDAVGQHQHTPVAWYEGRLVVENALKGNHRAVDYRLLPTTVFTIPALAQVGLTEAEARRQGFNVAVNRAPFEDSSAAAVREETEGLVKVVSDESNGRILGVHILGAGAEDLIHIAAVAMRGGLRREDLAAMHYVFPTVAGSVFDAMWG